MAIIFRDDFTSLNFSQYTSVEGTPIFITSPANSAKVAVSFTSTPTQLCRLWKTLSVAYPALNVGFSVIFSPMTPLGETDSLAEIISELWDRSVGVSLLHRLDGTTAWQLSTPLNSGSVTATIQENTKYFVEIRRAVGGAPALWVDGVKLLEVLDVITGNGQHILFGAMSPTNCTIDYEDVTIADAYIGMVSPPPPPPPVIPPVPKHNLSISSSISNISTIIKEVISMSAIVVSTPWSDDLDEGQYDIEVPDVVTDPLLPANQYYKLKSWDDASTNRVRRINLTSDMAISFDYELVSLPPEPTPKPNVLATATLGIVSTLAGFIIAKIPGAIVGGTAVLVGTYIAPRFALSTAQCTSCRREFKFTTYNESVWCPYCHSEQVVRKQSIRRG